MSNETALLPINEVERMARAVAASGLFGIKTPEQAMALMLVAQAEGMHPAIVARDYDIVNGRPAKKAEAMLRSFMDAGGKVEWHALSDTLADATFSHAQGGSVRIAWDLKRAAQAGLASKDTWKKYPRQMLRSRVVSEGVRTVCPSATSGMYVPEEVRDLEPRGAQPAPAARDMGSAEIVQPEAAPQAPEPSAELLDAAANAASAGLEAYAAWWKAASKEDRVAIGASRHADFKAMAETAGVR
jgi:hypothetical protein